MKHIIISLFILPLLFQSCNKEPDVIKPDIFIQFHPRECNTILAGFVTFSSTVYDGQTFWERENIIDNTVTATNTNLVIYTSGSEIPILSFAVRNSEWAQAFGSENVSTHNPTLEQQIEANYFSKKRTTTQKKSYLQTYEYRTTGISDLTITCNKKLFGKAAGVSLNEHFYLDALYPKHIVSHDEELLLFGKHDNLNKMSIEEWLSLKPLAQPQMELKFGEVPPELPAKLQFNVKLTTVDGLVIENTTQEINFTI